MFLSIVLLFLQCFLDYRHSDSCGVLLSSCDGPLAAVWPNVNVNVINVRYLSAP